MKWARRAVWGTLAAVLTIGCNPLTTIGFLMHQDQKVPAAYPLKPKEGPDGKKKDEVTVAVLCGTTGGTPIEFAGSDRELASKIAKQLPDILKGSGGKDKITVLPPAKVDKFKMDNPNWKAMHPTAIGKKLGVDYVVDITLGGMRIYQPGSNNQIYEGRAEVTVDVYDSAADGGEQLYQYVHPFSYPRGMVRDAGVMPVSRFKQLYLENLATDLILMHIEHKPSEGIASADR